jgi:hypothetical protein
MDATLILIDSDAELARARALVDRLWDFAVVALALVAPGLMAALMSYRPVQTAGRDVAEGEQSASAKSPAIRGKSQLV